MALNRVAKFNWDRILSKVDSADAKRSLNLVRAKANEITANSSKYGQAVEEIDFSAYKKKLKFTSSAVDALEAAYKKKTLPVYTATLPPFETKKREMTLATVKEIVKNAHADVAQLDDELKRFEEIRIKDTTSTGQLLERFPQIAREIETELKNHEWTKSGI